MKFRLIVFDWDGTLMDSQARIVDCMKAAIADLGMAARSDEQIRDIIGLGLAEAVHALFPKVSKARQEELFQAYRHQYLVENQTPSPLFEGAREAVQSVADMGYLLAVATGKGRGGLDRVLESTGMGPMFHATRCADETLSKPHPQMLNEIMSELGAGNGETLMIGDSEYDLQMARNAGTHGLAVTYGVHSRERLQQHRPLGCLDDIRDLPQWVGTQAAG